MFLIPKRKFRRGLIAAVLAAFAWGSAPAAADSAPALVKAAKAEGELVLYTAMQRKVIADSVKQFEKKYGIKVTFVRKGSGGTIQLIEAERKTGAYKADVVDLWDPATFRLWKEQGLFMAYKPAGGDNIAGFLQDKDWEIVTASPVTEVIVYNTRLVKAEDAPKSFKDLLDPKWSGKLAHSDPNYSGSTTMGVNVLANLYGWEFYEKLAAQKPLIVQSIGAVPRLLLSGEAHVGVLAVDADIKEFKAKGEPLAVVYASEGVPFFTWDAGILKTATHVNAAKLWMDFLMSKEHQAYLATRMYYPSRTDVDPPVGAPPLKSLKFMNPDLAWLQVNKKEQNNKFTETMREATRK
ncbi:extracellular solute-binding protein [bacterium SCSIO 12827]|nr:extracellular solute-binding protein [bacterium SCSIO 12827]